MKVLVLSGGIGKRLKPITDYVPKSLVPINNVPIIEWQIRYFKKFGVNEFVICAGHKSEQIINYFEAKKNLKVKIDYSVEKTTLGTGGAIRKASRLINDESFFVINGDIITNLDPRPLRSKKNSIAVVPLRTSFGLVDIVGDKVRKFREKPHVSDLWINAGIYHLLSDILQHLPRVGNIEDTIFPVFAAKGDLAVVKYTNALWHSIDSHKDIEECSNNMKANHYNDFLLKR